MIKKFLFFQICFVLSITSYSQSKISIEDLINQNIERTINVDGAVIDENFPWINEYELRTETRDLNFGKQEYSLRLSPNSPKIRSAQQSIYRQLAYLPDFEQQEIYCDFINESFKDIISLYLTGEQLKIYEAWEIVIADKQLVLSRLTGSLDFNYKEVLDLIELKTKVNYNKEKLTIEKNQLRKKYNLIESAIDFSSIINLDKIKEIIEIQESATDTSPADGVLNLEDQYDLDLAQKELELEFAERKQYLDFVQLKYQGPHDNLFGERFSVGLGLRLPNSSNQKLKIKELELKQSNIISESKADQKKSIQSLTIVKHKLNLTIKFSEAYTQLIDQENSALDNMTAQIQRDNELDPLLLLDIKNRQIETKLNGIKLIADVYSDYLDYISESGLACDSKNDIVQLISIE